MEIFIEKNKEILAKKSSSFVSSHFTWGEGNVETTTVVTDYEAQIHVALYCDNPALYRLLGGLMTSETMKVDNRYNDHSEYDSDFFYEEFDGFWLTGFRCISYGNPTYRKVYDISHSGYVSYVSHNESWLCFVGKLEEGDDEIFRYRIIKRAKDRKGLHLVRRVIIKYTYQTTVHYR